MKERLGKYATAPYVFHSLHLSHIQKCLCPGNSSSGNLQSLFLKKESMIGRLIGQTLALTISADHEVITKVHCLPDFASNSLTAAVGLECSYNILTQTLNL